MKLPSLIHPPLRHFLAAMAACAAMAAPLLAQAQFLTTYTVTTDLLSPTITNIVMLETEDPDGYQGTMHMTRPFQAAGFGNISVLDNPFDRELPIQRSLLLGIVRDLPNDAPGQRHLVLMMDDQAASNAAGIAWGTIFTTTLEENLLAAVFTVSTKFTFEDLEDPVVQAALVTVFDFGRNVASQAKLGPSGAPASAWFTTGGSFSVMAWSNAQRIGTGISAMTAVPEPATWALWLGALGTLGALKMRRRAAST